MDSPKAHMGCPLTCSVENQPAEVVNRGMKSSKQWCPGSEFIAACQAFFAIV